jgi:excisionase family DNA binding protein
MTADQLLTVAEVAARLHVNREVVLDWLRRHELLGTHPDGNQSEWRVSEQAIEDFLENRRKQDSCLL